MKKLYIYTLLAITIFSSPKLIAQVNLNDSLALVDLYNSTDGPHWNDHTNWLTTAPVNTWYGVSVSSRRVYELELHSNNLKGTLPASLGNLTKFIYLDLDNNQLSGSIPSELGNLTGIYRIALNNNQLSGSIPSSFGNFEHINDLYLNNNQLSGNIPSELGNLRYPRNINLSYNQLSDSIPSSLGNLKYLNYLYLNNNQLSDKIPIELTNLKGLLVLDLSNNQLSGNISEKLDNCTILRVLKLDSNQLTGKIPFSLGSLWHLEELNLKYNNLRDSIPSSLGNLPSLQYLILSHNNLSGNVPASLGNLKYLKILNFQHNHLSGTVPASLTNLNKLNRLRLGHNWFIFDGTELIAQHFNALQGLVYTKQRIIRLHQNNNTFSVYAGGTLSNNTYKWYKDGSLVSTINGDSTFTPTSNGVYYVEVTNAVATALTLSSDTIHYSSSSGLQNDAIASSLSNNKNGFSVYPNPAHDFINLYLNSNAGNAVINVYDMNGKKIITQKATLQKGSNINLNAASLAPGTYSVELIADEKTFRQKFIKQ